MGAHSWSEHLPGPDLDQAFADRASRDRAEYGADAYTGTVGQAHGAGRATDQVCHPLEASFLADQLTGDSNFEPQHDYSDPEARANAENVADRRASKLLLQLGANLGISTYRTQIHRTRGAVAAQRGAWGGTVGDLPIAEKWGSVYAIPTGEADAFKVTERAVPLDVTRLGLTTTAAWDPAVREHVYDSLLEQLGQTPRIATLEVLDDNPRYTTKVAATDGAVVTRYRIYCRDRHGSLHPTREQPVGSMAAARARITELLKQPPGPNSGYDSGNVEYAALGERVRADGSPLLIGSRELVSRLVVYKVTLVVAKKSSTPVTGWQVYGVAAS